MTIVENIFEKGPVTKTRFWLWAYWHLNIFIQQHK